MMMEAGDILMVTSFEVEYMTAKGEQMGRKGFTQSLEKLKPGFHNQDMLKSWGMNDSMGGGMST